MPNRFAEFTDEEKRLLQESLELKWRIVHLREWREKPPPEKADAPKVKLLMEEIKALNQKE